MAAKKPPIKKAPPSLSAIKTASTGKVRTIIFGGSDLYEHIRVGELQPHPQNDYRNDDTEALDLQLAADMRRNGQYHNLVVSLRENGDKVILSGERRWRAAQLNQKAYPGEAKWDTLYCQIRTGLSPLDELIIMDAANIQARGHGAGDEKRLRKIMNRFIGNLKQYGISEEEAQKMTAEMGGVSVRTVRQNVSIENNMLPALLALADANVFGKKNATAYAALTPEEQAHIVRQYQRLVKAGDRVYTNEYSDSLLAAINRADAVEGVLPHIQAKPKKARATIEEKTSKDILKIAAAVKALSGRAEYFKKNGEGSNIKSQLEALQAQLAEVIKAL